MTETTATQAQAAASVGLNDPNDKLTTAEYRRRVMMTLSQKQAKEALRKLGSNTKQTNITHAVIGINTEVGEFMKGISSYLSGVTSLKPEFDQNAKEELGDTLYYVAVLAKMLKVPMPSITKRKKLKSGTLTEAILRMHGTATDMLDITKKTFYGVEYKQNDETNKAEYDKAATLEKFTERNAIIAEKLESFMEDYWAVVNTMFNKPPEFIAKGNIAKLAARYPKGFFDKAAQEDRDTDEEMAAMEAASD